MMADGHGRDGHRVDRHLRHDPAAPAVARPRPLRAVQRPRVDAAVRAAAPERLRPAAGRAQSVPPVAQQDPGPPRVGVTPGVETTTGPLGPGPGNAVGMALAEKLLAAEFNRPATPSSTTAPGSSWGDGCPMEGHQPRGPLAGRHAAPAQAGGLYDDNGISIDGWRRRLVHRRHARRASAYGWNVVDPVDGTTSGGRRRVGCRRAQGDAPDGKAHAGGLPHHHRQGARPPRRRTHDARRAAGAAEMAAARRIHRHWTGGCSRSRRRDPRRVETARRPARICRAGRADEALEAAYPAQAAEFERRMAGTKPEGSTRQSARLAAKTRCRGPAVLSNRKAIANAGRGAPAGA